MNRTILLVEDNEADAALVSRAIKKTAFKAQLLHVSNGEAAVRYLESKTPYHDRFLYPVPAMILLDIKLPGINGFEVISWIRKQPSPMRRIAIVMLTSSAQLIDVNQAYELGANSYLQKPDRYEDLIALLNSFDEYWFTRNALPEVVDG